MYFVPEAARPKTQQSPELLWEILEWKVEVVHIQTLQRLFSQAVFISCLMNSSKDITSCNPPDGFLSGVCLCV